MRFVVEAVVAVIIVVEAYGIVERPVNVGEALKTRLPVPVVPVTDERRLAAEIVETRTLLPSVATRREAVRLERVVAPVTFRVPAVARLPEESIVVEAVLPAAKVLAVKRPAKKLEEVALVKTRVEGREKVGFPPGPEPLVMVVWFVVPVSVRAVTPEVPLLERMPVKLEKVSEDVAVSAPPKKEVPETYELPWTENLFEGVVVPMPTLPVVARKSEDVGRRVLVPL